MKRLFSRQVLVELKELTDELQSVVCGGVECQNHINYREDPNFFGCPTSGGLNVLPPPPAIPGPALPAPPEPFDPNDPYNDGF